MSMSLLFHVKRWLHRRQVRHNAHWMRRSELKHPPYQFDYAKTKHVNIVPRSWNPLVVHVDCDRHDGSDYGPV